MDQLGECWNFQLFSSYFPGLFFVAIFIESEFLYGSIFLSTFNLFVHRSTTTHDLNIHTHVLLSFVMDKAL